VPTDSLRAPDRSLAARAALPLEFANTLHWHASDHPHETLHRYEDLLAWAAEKGAVTRRQAGTLSRRARRDPGPAQGVLRRAIALREAIYRVFVARVAGAAPAGDDVTVLNRELHRALLHYRVEIRAGGATWHLAAADAQPDGPLWPVVLAAVELLLSGELAGRVGQCADPSGCGWLFLDLSKNRSRRWCSIADCGNRAKQRRLKQRMSGSG
jgi:predicted RNA-binding Zn ribbon-like protein